MTKVVDLASFRAKKARAIGVQDTFGENDLGARLARIRESINRINQLMGELRRMNGNPADSR